MFGAYWCLGSPPTPVERRTLPCFVPHPLPPLPLPARVSETIEFLLNCTKFLFPSGWKRLKGLHHLVPAIIQEAGSDWVSSMISGNTMKSAEKTNLQPTASGWVICYWRYHFENGIKGGCLLFQQAVKLHLTILLNFVKTGIRNVFDFWKILYIY